MRATSLILWFGLPVFTVASGCRSNEAGSPTASKAMTVEWIYTEGRTADDLPKSAWRADGQAILLDVCTPAEAPTLELLDPSTGERRPMVDASRARKSLLALVDVDLEGDWLWPDSFDRAGLRALYIFEDDLFVLDVASSAFARLTTTPQIARGLCVHLWI